MSTTLSYSAHSALLPNWHIDLSYRNVKCEQLLHKKVIWNLFHKTYLFSLLLVYISSVLSTVEITNQTFQYGSFKNVHCGIFDTLTVTLLTFAKTTESPNVVSYYKHHFLIRLAFSVSMNIKISVIKWVLGLLYVH